MTQWPAYVWTAIVGALGTVATVVAKLSTTRADAAATLTGAELQFVQELQEELHGLRERMGQIEAEQRRERAWCDMRINQLVASLHAEGIDVPPPPERT